MSAHAPLLSATCAAYNLADTRSSGEKTKKVRKKEGKEKNRRRTKREKAEEEFAA